MFLADFAYKKNHFLLSPLVNYHLDDFFEISQEIVSYQVKIHVNKIRKVTE